MQQIVKAMGRQYQTNCYILIQNDQSLIIDPGIDSEKWVIDNAVNPIAILNTHGHFDHTWCNAALQNRLHIPIYIHKADVFMIESDIFGYGQTPSKADFAIDDEKQIELGGFSFRFIHCAGHTPGCSMIEFDDRIFSGDFIFDNTIGRYDFPYSNAHEMKQSLEKFMCAHLIDKEIFPGHGGDTTVEKAKKFIPYFIDQITQESIV
jgi:glyoxylase-like metal-dependent hydrolase (beta-lactamase superfamily II)